MKWQSYKTLWLATAAALPLVVIGVFFFVSAGGTTPNGKRFAFIPHYGILENNKTIRYVVSELSFAESADASMVLQNVYATGDEIKVTVEVTRKGITQEQAIAESESSIRPDATLRADHFSGAGYDAKGYRQGGAFVSLLTFSFKVKPDDIRPGVAYRFEHSRFKLPVDFKLKEYESFESLDQIGATATHNNISITAVPERKNGVLTVELYSVNKSGYRIYSFSDGGRPGKTLHLETSSGDKTFTTPRIGSTPNRVFFFDVASDDKDLVLEIPHIVVVSDESRSVSLKVPAAGLKTVINEKVEFENSTMTIVDVEKTHTTGPYGELTMTLRYDNKRPNMVMQFAEFERTDFWGFHQGGGYGPKVENGVYVAVSYDLEKDENPLRLRIRNPTYYLTDPYRLKLDK